ncbi:MAG TPA: HNH endonuclease signature motif containing protein, partial [Xanthobacteraceae bacterium]|nr:HNH endonuclease signature motif containing protein [Xanthobacteraceae bacterium]
MPAHPPVHRPIGVQTSAERRAAYDAARVSPSRIYGRRWQKLRRAFLAAHPLCQCDDNGGAGCGYAAAVVDHRIPHNGDLALLFAWDNLQAMTKACHDRKTAARDGGFGNPRRPPDFHFVRGKKC